MLVLEIEFLLGVSFAAIGPDSAEPDWPPQPDRVFSALVAAWAARGHRPDERAALEWLEAREPPRLAASDCFVRPAPTVYVPPNDPQSGRVGDRTVLPVLRRRQARRFPAALPDDPIVRLIWPDTADAPVPVLDALARDTASIGHSASLTRCRFLTENVAIDDLPLARRRVYPGRMRELEAAFASGRRPPPGATVRVTPPPPAAGGNTFGGQWLVFEISRGDSRSDPPSPHDLGALDIHAAPIAARALRDALLSGFGKAGLDIPAWISGHAGDGAPTREPHLAVVPMTFTGFPHADGSLIGLAIIPPSVRGDPLDDADLVAALRCVTTDQAGRRTLALTLGRDGVLRLRIALESERASLDPQRYLTPAQTWASVTPIVLDRHLKAKTPPERAAEAQAIVGEACRRIGLPVPTVRLDKHSAIRGAASAAPSGRAPRWTGWRMPNHIAGRPLVHAVLHFAEPVAGPVLLGAGRFCGLGLCLPLPLPADSKS